MGPDQSIPITPPLIQRSPRFSAPPPLFLVQISNPTTAPGLTHTGRTAFCVLFPADDPTCLRPVPARSRLPQDIFVLRRPRLPLSTHLFRLCAGSLGKTRRYQRQLAGCMAHCAMPSAGGIWHRQRAGLNPAPKIPFAFPCRFAKTLIRAMASPHTPACASQTCSERRNMLQGFKSGSCQRRPL